jgi:hypothetical protein
VKIIKCDTFALFINITPLNNMELTLKQIAEKLPLYFKSGEPELLRQYMFKDDNTFLRFSGKEQYYSKIKAIIPDIDPELLCIDYDTSRALIMSCKYYLRNIYNINYSPKEIFIKFHYDEPLQDYSPKEYAHQFKILDGIVRPFTDSFWNTYLPPNFIGDGCHFSVLPKMYSHEVSEIILFDLPTVNSDFIIDRFNLFLSDYSKNILSKPTTTLKKDTLSDNYNLLASFGIDIEELVLDSFLELNNNMDDTEKETLRLLIKKEFGSKRQ